MSTVKANLPTGKKNGRVVRVNPTASAKLGMFSTIISFNEEIDGKYGKSIANSGYFGVMLTEKHPADLKPGQLVATQIVSYQTSVNPNDPNGQESTIARCLFLGEVAEVPARAQAARAEGATA
jgi:hypothetical protein